MKKIQRRQFRIGELAEKLGVETSVIRFWEKEFKIESTRSEGQQRFFTEKDLAKFAQIKELLYVKKYTIAGAKDILVSHFSRSNGFDKLTTSALELRNESQNTFDLEVNLEPTKKVESIKIIPSKLENKILELQEHLLKLKELL